MKFLSQTLVLLLGLGLLAALGLGGYRVVASIMGLFTSLDFQVARITAIASVVALLVALIIAHAIRRSAGPRIANQVMEGKAATYRRLIDLWLGLIQDGRGAEGRSRSRSPEELRDLERSLALYGSAKVLKAHVVLRALEREGRMQSTEVKSELVKALLEIRADLGSETVGLTLEDLHRLLFADAETVSTPGNASDYQGRRLPMSLRSDP